MDRRIVEENEIECQHRDHIQTHDAHGQGVGRDSSFGKALEEARAYLQTDAVDEEDETEVLDIVQYGRGAGEPDVACQDACEQHKGDTKGDAENLEAAEEYTHGDDQRVEHHDVRDAVGLSKKVD